MDQPPIQIARDEGVIELTPQQGGRGFNIVLLPRSAALYIPRTRCQTTFPLELIRCWIDHTSFAWLCDGISRHEDPTQVEAAMKRQVLSYFPAEHFVGKRMLDFGCGTGASTFALAKILPQTEIVGCELDPSRVELALRMKAFYAAHNATFRCSPSGDHLPEDIGSFDFVMLSAVYEHLLPQERQIVMPLLWSAMKPGGAIFINQTPYRYSPYEAHSTGLWLVNYLPDWLAHWTVRHFAARNLEINRSPDWDVHLRGGLRGGTERGSTRHLTGNLAQKAQVLQPHQNGLQDRADFWLSGTSPSRYRTLKRSIAGVFRITDRIWGTIPGLNLDVVIEKLA